MRLVDPRRRVDRQALGLFAPLILACSGGSDASTRSAPAGAAVSVAPSAVGAIERERGVSTQQALELAGEDALLAKALSDAEPRLAHWIERVVLARQLLAALGDEARAGGPPTDREVEAISEARFWELARPRMVKVVHAVVLSPKEDEAARALAQQIVSAARGAKTSAQFQKAARGVAAGKFSVKVESLPPVALDGRAVDPASPPPVGASVQHFDPDFAAAAQRLTVPAEQSPVVRSAYGYHVIFLISVIEPKQPGLDERRALLHAEIMTQRAQALSSALLEQQRREIAPEQARSALASMQLISLPPPSLPPPGALR